MGMTSRPDAHYAQIISVHLPVHVYNNDIFVLNGIR